MKLLCFTKFGVAGQQILSDTLIPLQPFAKEPTKLDLDIDAAGHPIPGQYTYTRRSLTTEELASQRPNTAQAAAELDPLPLNPANTDVEIAPLLLNTANLPLSTQGNTNYRDDRKIFTDAKRRLSDHDTEYLDHLYRHLSPASHTSMKTHADYPAYQLLPIGSRSYAFNSMARSIQTTSNAATKLH